MDNGIAIELLEEYNDWVTQKNITANDVTPTQFMIERAQRAALNRLVEIDEYIATFPEELFESPEIQELVRRINE